MGWDRGYYYRARKVNGRVVKDYFGNGRPAELMAEIDAIDREQRRGEALARQQERQEWEAAKARVAALENVTDLLARAALLAAGYRQHKRGDWRKKRVRPPDQEG